MEKKLNECCAFCRFWNADETKAAIKECRVGGPSKAEPKWPSTHYKEWCGRHKQVVGNEMDRRLKLY